MMDAHDGADRSDHWDASSETETPVNRSPSTSSSRSCRSGPGTDELDASYPGDELRQSHLGDNSLPVGENGSHLEIEANDENEQNPTYPESDDGVGDDDDDDDELYESRSFRAEEAITGQEGDDINGVAHGDTTSNYTRASSNSVVETPEKLRRRMNSTSSEGRIYSAVDARHSTTTDEHDDERSSHKQEDEIESVDYSNREGDGENAIDNFGFSSRIEHNATGHSYGDSRPNGSSMSNGGPHPFVENHDNENIHIQKSPTQVSAELLNGPLSDQTQQSQITHNDRRRARYSWQSIQDDEQSLRPRINVVKLVSDTTSSSAGFPGGEALQFSISPGGRRIAAFNSARLYILQTAALPLGISQDYALKRRPLAVEVLDDGNAMAILADHHTVNVYDLSQKDLRRITTLKLDFPTHCIALSQNGGLIAAAYEGGIEVFSLAASALPTDRRAVRTPRVDRMAFSTDSSTLLGTTTRINASSTVIVSVPVFPAAANGIPTHDELKVAWCSDILQPEIVRNSSHATFLRENRTTSNERLFAWNGIADTFGILNLTDFQYGNIDFPVVIIPPLSTCGGLGAAIHSCPTVDENGETVAMVVNDRTVRLYIIPKVDENATTVEAQSIDHALDEGLGNAFTDIRWVCSSSALLPPLDNSGQIKGRLVVASPGGVVGPNTNISFGTVEESIDEIEGGRIIVLDFDAQFLGEEGQTYSLTLGTAQPHQLEEEEVNVTEQVAIVRRRTVNQRKGVDMFQRPLQLGRAATTFSARNRRSRREFILGSNQQSETNMPLPDVVEDGEVLDAFEEPYQQSAPRSHASLQRAATNVQRHRFQTLEERERDFIPFDAFGDVPSLPEYTETPNTPLPSRYRAMAGLDQPAPPPLNAKSVTNADGDQATSVPQSPQVPNIPTFDDSQNDTSTQASESAFATSVPVSAISRSMTGSLNGSFMLSPISPLSVPRRRDTTASFSSAVSRESNSRPEDTIVSSNASLKPVQRSNSTPHVLSDNRHGSKRTGEFTGTQNSGRRRSVSPMDGSRVSRDEEPIRPSHDGDTRLSYDETPHSPVPPEPTSSIPAHNTSITSSNTGNPLLKVQTYASKPRDISPASSTRSLNRVNTQPKLTEVPSPQTVPIPQSTTSTNNDNASSTTFPLRTSSISAQPNATWLSPDSFPHPSQITESSTPYIPEYNHDPASNGAPTNGIKHKHSKIFPAKSIRMQHRRPVKKRITVDHIQNNLRAEVNGVHLEDEKKRRTKCSVM